MKNLKNRAILSFVLAAVTIAVSFTSCKKNESPSTIADVQSIKSTRALTSAETRLWNLAANWLKEGDDQFIETVLAEYRALSGAELDNYYKIWGEYELAKLESQKRAGSINAAHYEFYKHKQSKLTAFRIKANQLFQAKFGKPLNAGTGEELDPILTGLLKGEYAGADAELPHPSAKKDASVSVYCPPRHFPDDASKTDGNGLDDYYWELIEPNNQGDCDYGFNYLGSLQRRVDPDNAGSTAMLSAQGNHAARFSGSSDTRVLFGANAIALFCAGTNGVNVEMLYQ